MVRINIISPSKLSDQHLIAEYNEILKLLGHTKKHPGISSQPASYCLGRGHINFFKDKLAYLKQRHKKIRKEMKRRSFRANKEISLKGFNRSLKKGWKPKKKDFETIKPRLRERLRQKPGFYRYYGEYKHPGFFEALMKHKQP